MLKLTCRHCFFVCAEFSSNLVAEDVLVSKHVSHIALIDRLSPLVSILQGLLLVSVVILHVVKFFLSPL